MSCGEYDASVGLYKSVENFSVFVAVVKLVLVVDKAFAKTCEKSCRFIKVIPCDILYVIRNGMVVAVCNIAVNVYPVCAFLKGDETSEPGFAGNIIFCAVFGLTECAARHLTCIVKGIGQTVNGAYARIHGVIGLVEIVEIRFAVLGCNRLPA